MNRVEAAAVARAAKAARNAMPDRFWSKVDIRGPNECWPWKAAARKPNEGYGAFYLDGRHQPASRVAAQLSGTNFGPGQQALHRCDNPSCCNPAHIFAGTNLENVADKVAKNRHAAGERAAGAVLTQEDVAYLRSLKPPAGRRLQPGVCQSLADKFGVTRRYISEVMRRGWGIPK